MFRAQLLFFGCDWQQAGLFAGGRCFVGIGVFSHRAVPCLLKIDEISCGGRQILQQPKRRALLGDTQRTLTHIAGFMTRSAFHTRCREAGRTGPALWHGIKVAFEDENGTGDGVRREWFALLAAELTNPDAGGAPLALMNCNGFVVMCDGSLSSSTSQRGWAGAGRCCWRG